VNIDAISWNFQPQKLFGRHLHVLRANLLPTAPIEIKFFRPLVYHLCFVGFAIQM